MRHFGSGDELVRAVDGVDLLVDAGEIFGFLGPNGAGKTTTVRMLTTLLRPTSGKATVAGYDVVDAGRSGAALDRCRAPGRGDRSADDRHRTVAPPSRSVRPAEGSPRDSGRRVARTGRAHGGRQSTCRHLLGRDEAAPRPRHVVDPRTVGVVPRRTDDRSRSDEPDRHCGRRSDASTQRARRCCSRRNTWRRRTNSPTRSRSSITG